MRTNTACRREGGNALVAALVIGAVVGISLLAYLTWASVQNQLIMRSQAWNGALPLAEAGLEEAMTHISKVGTNNRAQDSWVLQNGHYTKTRTMGDGYYLVQIATHQNPTILAEGFVKAPLQKNHYISRKVRITTTNDPIYFGGMVSDQHIDLHGNNVYVDSYDSEDPNHSTGGLYDAAKRKDNGTVATNLGITNSINLGNANVFGKTLTGPGGTVEVGPSGAVGSIAWQDAGNIGLQPGWTRDDFNTALDLIPPFPSGGLVPAGGKVGTTKYDYILGDGNWEVPELTGSIYISGNATLTVQNKFNMAGVNDAIVIAPGASLKIYYDGPLAKIGADAVDNQTGNPDSFHYYGGPNNQTLALQGSVYFNGLINAPATDIQVGGGGGAVLNIVGALVGKSITMTGHVNLHFDEALMRKYSKGYVITSWTEL